MHQPGRKWGREMVLPMPQDPPGCTPDVYGQAGAEVDGNVFKLSLPMPKSSRPESCSPGLSSCARKGRLHSSWKHDSCCMSHDGIWGACLLLQMLSTLQTLQSSRQRAADFSKPCKKGCTKNMFFTLSAASKAQVSQIYFPCKLFLHN